MIPHPVMIGFCNGLAIVIGFAQLALYKDADDSGGHRRRLNVFEVFNSGGWIEGSEAAWSAAITVLCFLMCVYFPKINKSIPSSLVALLVGTGMEWAIVRQCGDKTMTVGDFSKMSQVSFNPNPHSNPLTLQP